MRRRQLGNLRFAKQVSIRFHFAAGEPSLSESSEAGVHFRRPVCTFAGMHIFRQRHCLLPQPTVFPFQRLDLSEYWHAVGNFPQYRDADGGINQCIPLCDHQSRHTSTVNAELVKRVLIASIYKWLISRQRDCCDNVQCEDERLRFRAHARRAGSRVPCH